MNSLDHKCNNLKQKYDSCFNLWFSDKFLKGESNLFVLYRDCVREAIKKQNINLSEIDKRVLGTSEEEQPPNQGKPESP